MKLFSKHVHQNVQGMQIDPSYSSHWWLCGNEIIPNSISPSVYKVCIGFVSETRYRFCSSLTHLFWTLYSSKSSSELYTALLLSIAHAKMALISKYYYILTHCILWENIVFLFLFPLSLSFLVMSHQMSHRMSYVYCFPTDLTGWSFVHRLSHPLGFSRWLSISPGHPPQIWCPVVQFEVWTRFVMSSIRCVENSHPQFS